MLIIDSDVHAFRQFESGVNRRAVLQVLAIGGLVHTPFYFLQLLCLCNCLELNVFQYDSRQCTFTSSAVVCGCTAVHELEGLNVLLFFFWLVSVRFIGNFLC
jgi:hypothetical protein